MKPSMQPTPQARQACRGWPLSLLFVLLLGLGQVFQTHAQDLVWVRQLGGTGLDQGYSVAVDGTGNVYTTGFFESTVDLDPGPGMFDLTSTGFGDIFVSKLDANGDFVWARQLGGTNFEASRSVAVDGAGNVYTMGYFRGTAAQITAPFLLIKSPCCFPHGRSRRLPHTQRRRQSGHADRSGNS